MLITTKKIDLGGARQKFEIEWFPVDGDPLPPQTPDESKERANARKRNKFVLLVEQIDTISLNELMNDLSNSATIYPLKLEAIQALNIILAYGPSTDSSVAVAGQNRFYPFQSHPQFRSTDLTGGLDALRGYFSSVRTSISRILVNVNVANAAFYKAGPLLEMMRSAGGAPKTETEFRRLSSFVRKLRIETNYIPDRDNKGNVRKSKDGQPLTKRKVHTITDLSPFGTHSRNTSFNWTNRTGKSERITVEEYFRRTYNIKLTTWQAPVVNYGPKDDPKWIPSELCTVLPGQLANRLLLGNQTRAMIEFAARRPFQNAESIVNDGLQVTKINPVAQGLNTHLKKFGIKVNPNLLTVPGRILPPPALSYRAKTFTPVNGAWNLDTRMLGDKPFRITRPLPSWNCLVINSGRETIYGGMNALNDLLAKFRQTLSTCGLSPGPVQSPIAMNVDWPDLQNRNVKKVQQELSQKLKSGFKQKPQFLFIILPDDNAVLYDCIKYVCDVQLGVPNICSIGHKFSKEKGQIQYFSNVALKFNQKLGGINHSLEGNRLQPLDNQTIVFGIDVTHPSPGSADSSPSIAGIVASVDQNFAQYPASIRTQKGRQEMVEELEEMVVERLRLWQKRNQGRLPSKVIVYRDGVSEGQYRIVLETEYPSFVGAFNKLYGAAKKHPKISIVVVGKRHHTRFYPTKKEDSDQKTGNPQPGTIVDRGVTGEKLFDFFLLAHQGLQGTSKPAHYVVLKDENKLGADQLQSLVSSMCQT